MLILSLLMSLVSHAADSGTFCVQTINAHGTAFASNVPGRLRLLATTLNADEPCAAYHFQEIWQTGDYDGFVPQLRPAGMRHFYADRLRSDSSLTGLASAYPGAVASTQAELYRWNESSGFGVQKGFLLAQVKLAEGPELLLWNTHTNPRSDPARIAQAVQTADLLLNRELPVVLTGDLNDYPDSVELLVLQKVLLLNDSYFDVNRTYEGICTFCKNNPGNDGDKDEILDYVLYRSSATVELRPVASSINLREQGGEPISDHYGVRTRFAFASRAGTLLPENDPVVQRRRAEAVAALDKAVLELNKAGGQYRSASQKAKELATQIRDSRAGTAFRIP